MAWDVLCSSCGGGLVANTSLKTIDQDVYACSLRAIVYEPTLDEMVEVAFTVSPRVRGSRRTTRTRRASSASSR